MREAVIDIGSNSMRLTVYQVENSHFKILFKEKIMAGLAGYVEKGSISKKGIQRACEGLLQFRQTLTMLDLCERVHVFATASLRNIVNTDDAVAAIRAATGFRIDLITGEEEALLGYLGVMCERSVTNGLFADIGGASTEIVVFSEKTLLFSRSCPVGSLKLYKDCAEKLLPGNPSTKKMKQAIGAALPRRSFKEFTPQKQFLCTGGTARSVLKFAKYLELVPKDGNVISAKDLKKVGKLLLGDKNSAARAIAKVDPERIFTIIPGYLILEHIAEQFSVRKIIVCNYGVREGYLCQKVLP